MDAKMFGAFLAQVRRAQGLTQAELAEQLHVTDKAVSRWERDETMPETEKVVALANLFGVTTDYLLRDQPEEKEEAPTSGGERKRDWVDKLSYLAKTKGYLLGWVLVAWGVIDLLTIVLLGLGAISFMRIW